MAKNNILLRKKLSLPVVLLIMGLFILGGFIVFESFAGTKGSVIFNKCQLKGKAVPNSNVEIFVSFGEMGGSETMATDKKGKFTWDYTQGSRQGLVTVVSNGKTLGESNMGPCKS